MSKKPKAIEERIDSWLFEFGKRECMFRGQSISDWSVTSTLYRAFCEKEKQKNLSRLEKKKGFSRLEKNVLAAARFMIWPHEAESEIFADIQHMGGLSNYIDFTTNIHVAVYFACAHNLQKDGAVYFLKSQELPVLHPFEFGIEFCKELGMAVGNQDTSLAIALPGVNRVNFNRVVMQESVFIQAKDGCIDRDRFCKIETIKAEDKQAALDYLENHSLVSYDSLFGDILGFVEKSRGLGPSNKPKRMQPKLNQYDDLEKEAARWRTRVKNLPGWRCPRFMNMGYSHYRLGRVYYSCGKYAEAESEFLKALEKGCGDPVQAKVYLNLASTYLRLGWHQDALGCLDKVRHHIFEELCHFMAAEAHFRAKNYKEAWDRISKAVEMNRYRLTYLRLQAAVAFKLDLFGKAVECANVYLSYEIGDEQIITIRDKARELGKQSQNLPSP